ncbi:WASH complex subunit 3 [Cinara cedri]|uniref:WASH complex subunit 3 n=1 Tax=Cinara cedri TaxID=506608 RepID=A0A5E4N9A3_9HEMI|nr:WASH complex subunit 3 [Cinara cedri]
MEELKNVPPMEQRRLVTYINHFITSTVQFLNNFITHCEAKMMKSEQRLQKISASLCILETKLNSVPELQEIEPQHISTKEPSVIQLENTSQNTVDESTNRSNTPNKTEGDIISKPVEHATVNESPNEPNVDPALLKYRKMLQFGVPRGAVELKMVHEGLDPNLL